MTNNELQREITGNFAVEVIPRLVVFNFEMSGALALDLVNHFEVQYIPKQED